MSITYQGVFNTSEHLMIFEAIRNWGLEDSDVKVLKTPGNDNLVILSKATILVNSRQASRLNEVN